MSEWLEFFEHCSLLVAIFHFVRAHQKQVNNHVHIANESEKEFERELFKRLLLA